MAAKGLRYESLLLPLCLRRCERRGLHCPWPLEDGSLPGTLECRIYYTFIPLCAVSTDGFDAGVNARDNSVDK